MGFLVSRAAQRTGARDANSCARCCWKCRWCWAATPPENLSRCATFARTARSLFRSASLTARPSSAPTTAGNSTRTPASASTIPSLTADSKLKCERIYAGSFPCEERDGYIWVFMTNPEGRAVDDAAAARRRSCRRSAPRYQIAHLWADLPCGVDQAIIGLMDPAHGPFVHQAWWWRSRHSIREKPSSSSRSPTAFA